MNIPFPYRSVIVLNSGEIEPGLLSRIDRSVPWIGADGAANGVDVDYVVGDGDSFLGKRNREAERIGLEDQDTTDFEKCIVFTRERGLLPSLVLGVGGGEIDHVLGNAQVLMKHGRDCSLFFLDGTVEEMKVGVPLFPGAVEISVRPGAIVSLIPFSPCTVTTEGMKWELEEKRLTIEGVLAIRNQAMKERVRIEVLEGTVLLVYG